MANEEQVEILKSGVEEWNRWRRRSYEVEIDLSGATFKKADFAGGDFGFADLRGIDLSDANLSSAYFVQANLGEANLNGGNLTRAILHGTRLDGANLCEANLRDAHLNNAYVIGSRLHRAKLIGASLWETNFSKADLLEADLHRAVLRYTRLVGANLRKANFQKAYLSYTDLHEANLLQTVFGGTEILEMDLRGIRNLNETVHWGPSHISLSTIYKSRGQIPHKFLRNAGVPENFITYMSSLTGKAFEYFSAFISYTEADDTFSKRLYEGLQAAGLRVWRWREDAKWGAPIEKNIDQAVRIYDKLIVICSQGSLKAPAVIDEIDRALQKEHALMKDGKIPEVLFPITIDEYIFDEWEHHLKPRVMSKTVGDFRDWEDPKKYDKALERLIAALRQEDRDGE